MYIPWRHRCICSAQSRNRDNSRIVPDKVGILTLSGEVGIPTWHGSIPESSQRKVGIGGKSENLLFSLWEVGIADNVEIFLLSFLFSVFIIFCWVQ